ncbi:MAG: hypothetical protein CMN76_12665 [Spirochaetaceae bacterium]|nr:hypothetical protein [Spirochaetaceae bacterium]|tara:strand:+ start:59914 stop:60519 length:606 start_codon:yes stop_codon:yes gene_type:complete
MSVTLKQHWRSGSSVPGLSVPASRLICVALRRPFVTHRPIVPILSLAALFFSFHSLQANEFWKRNYSCPGGATHTENRQTWSGSSALQEVKHLCNGQLQHIYEYDRNGKLNRIKTYNGGQETGWQYYLNTVTGGLMRKVMITNGRMNGPEESYYNTGELLSKGQYNYGVKVGTWIYYHKDGRKKKTLQYDGRGFLLKTTDH